MSKDKGYIKIYRDMLENPIVFRDADYVAIWMYLLLNARALPTEANFGGKRITLKPGQFTTGRKKIASDLRVSESKVQRVLKCFESEHQIEQRTDRQCRLITICSWDKYQANEQRNEHQMNNECTTSEQRVNTKKERKERKECSISLDKSKENRHFSKPTIEQIDAYIQEKGYHVTAEAIYDYYEANGWKVGRNPMKDWKACVRTWERRNNDDRRNAQYSRSGKTKHGLHTGTEYGADGREDIEAQRLRERTAKLEAAFARPNTLLDGDI